MEPLGAIEPFFDFRFEAREAFFDEVFEAASEAAASSPAPSPTLSTEDANCEILSTDSIDFRFPAVSIA